MLKIENVSFRYPGQKQDTLNNVSLEIEEGTFLAIVGSNGSGKSTLCKLFNGIIPHFFVGDIEGQIWVDELKTLETEVAILSSRVGYVYQDFENSIVRPNVLDEVCFGVLNQGYEDYKERALEALRILDLIDIKDEYVWQLSGGQKHLVALAAVLATQPKYIIIDEPVAQLDPFHAKQTYDKLRLLNEVYGITIIVIEHHTEFIADYCKEVVLLKAGEVKWKKSVKAALTSVEELIACNIFPPQVTQVAYQCSDERREYLPISIGEGKTFFCNHQSADIEEFVVEQGETQIETVAFNDITVGYKDYNKQSKIIIENMSLKFYAKERVAIVGNNGAGKSTMLRLIAKLLKPMKGEVSILGENIAAKSPEVISNKVSYIHQNPEEMFIEDSIEKDVAYFLRAREKDQFEGVVQEILEELNLIQMKERDPRLLSGGQQRRVSLAIGMGMTPEVILLDEPTASLDISSRRELLKLLELLDQYIKTSIVATHDMQLVADWATRVVVLSKGKVIFDGEPRELFAKPAILEQANLVPPQIVELAQVLEMSPICLSVEEFKERMMA